MWTVINLMHLSFSAFNNTAFTSFSLSIYLRRFSTKPISCYSLCIEVKLKCVQNKYTIQNITNILNLCEKAYNNHNFHRLTRTYQQLHKQVQCADEKNYISDFRRNTVTCAFNPNSDIKIIYLLVKTNFGMNFKRQTHILLNTKNYQGLISVPSNFLI